MALQIFTPEEGTGIEGRRSTVLQQPEGANPAEKALLTFNKLAAETQHQLHRCYHSKKEYFEQFAAGLGFAQKDILYLSIIIATKLCENCDDHRYPSNEFKQKEQENCGIINTYFDEINTYIQQYHQHIFQIYKEQSEKQFHAKNKTAPLIMLKPIKQELDTLFANCYQIIDSERPKPPNIKVTNGDIGGLVIEILDKDKAPNDKYEVVINDIKKEYIIDEDHKQQYFEIIDEIEPLTIYIIAARRYNAKKNKWSKYCDAVDIVTDVKFSWSKLHRGTNAKLSNLSREVRCKSKNGSCSIIGDRSISSLKFKEVMFSFKMHSVGQYSYCGFVQYSINVEAFEQNMRPYWDALVVKNPYSYCLGFCNGSSTIQRWVNGSKKKKSKMKNGSVKNRIQNGDVLLFDVDFDRNVCDVYLNDKTKQNRISSKNDENTFINIPNEIIPVYSHENNPYIIAHSKVGIKMESYALR